MCFQVFLKSRIIGHGVLALSCCSSKEETFLQGSSLIRSALLQRITMDIALLSLLDGSVSPGMVIGATGVGLFLALLVHATLAQGTPVEELGKSKWLHPCC